MRYDHPLLATLDYAFDKSSWHGPNLCNAIYRVKAQEAAWTPPGRKSVWQQVLHAAFWKQRVLNRVGNTPRVRFPRKGSNWPMVPETIGEEAWQADCDLLRDIHKRLRAAVAASDEKKLTPSTVRMIHGAALHDIYHAGQINLIKRMRQSS